MFAKDRKAEASKYTLIANNKNAVLSVVKNKETKAKSNDVFMFRLLLTFSTFSTVIWYLFQHTNNGNARTNVQSLK